MAEHDSAAPTRFERVVLPHLDAAYTLARYLSRDDADAEDAVQEAVLRAVQYFHTLRDDAHARAWLLAIVRRECYEGRTGSRDRADTISYDAEPSLQLVDPSDSPDALAQRSVMRTRVLSAVNDLPVQLRETIVLRELQECSYEEIAMITAVPMGTVMSRLSRARARLATALRDVVSPEELS